MTHFLSAKRHYLRRMVRSVELVSKTCGLIASLMILFSVVITCQMIVVRFVLNESTIWQTEAVTYLMISAVLIGLPYVQFLGGHVNVDLFSGSLSRNLRKIWTLFILGSSILVISIILFHSYIFFYQALSGNWKSESVWGISLWIPYLSLPIGFSFFMAQLIADSVTVLIDEPEAKPSFSKENH